MTTQTVDTTLSQSRPTSPTPTSSWIDGYGASMRRAHGYEPLRIEGRMPPELNGTLLRVGPAMFESAGRRYPHPFEGDGGVCGVRFTNGRAFGAHQLIDSAELAEERRAARPLYGSLASWLRRVRNGFTQSTKNAANTNVIRWQQRTLALYEVSKPTEIDDELATRGATDLGGVIAGGFSAHPHEVASHRAIYNFGMSYGPKSQLALYALPADGPARRLATLPIDRMMLHDFIATERHFVFFVSPVRLGLRQILLGRHDVGDLLRWQPELGTEILVVPIGDPSRVVRFRVGPFFQWHFANAFEDSGTIVVDFIRYRDFSSLEQIRRGMIEDGGELCRARLDAARESLAVEKLSRLPGEFPVIDSRVAGARHRKLWYVRDDACGHALHVVDVDSGAEHSFAFDDSERPAEALFVPRSDRLDDGWLVTIVFDARCGLSYAAVFDATRPDHGPLGRAWFNHHVPVTFHGTWIGSAS